MPTGRKFLLIASLLAMSVSGAFSQTTPASDYPTKTVRIIVPFSAGSNTDIMARVLADKLGSLWKQTIIVENKPGISGTISAANSPADGYTLMVTSNGHTILGFLNKDLPLDPIKAFDGVAEVASIPLVLIVTPEFKAASLKEFIALAKDKPGTLNFASAGLASSAYIAEELLKQTAAVDITHIPYKGTPEQLTSIMRGDSQLGMAFLGTALSLIRSGQVRALAIATSKRNPALQDVPTFAEAGLPQYHYDSWIGVMAPASTPAPILKKVSSDIASTLKDPDVLKRWEALGAVPVVSTPEQFDATIRSDADRYGAMLKAAGVAAN
jgi:tripartite-type tricarboxylate transporter receptor subunit TctC